MTKKTLPKSLQSKEKVLILNDIRSVENVGAMFRTADAAGVNKIYLSGYTPTPLDRFNRKRNDFHKSALGAEEYVTWEYVKNFRILMNKLKKEGFFFVGVEQDKNSVDFRELKNRLKNKNKYAFLMGNEVSGISKNILKKCDLIVEIPMHGQKESLNVSVTCGIILFCSL
jgi:23S rRNA (guanosine2251-2'-O)-methyltransferase